MCVRCVQLQSSGSHDFINESLRSEQMPPPLLSPLLSSHLSCSLITIPPSPLFSPPLRSVILPLQPPLSLISPSPLSSPTFCFRGSEMVPSTLLRGEVFIAVHKLQLNTFMRTNGRTSTHAGRERERDASSCLRARSEVSLIS